MRLRALLLLISAAVGAAALLAWLMDLAGSARAVQIRLAADHEEWAIRELERRYRESERSDELAQLLRRYRPEAD